MQRREERKTETQRERTATCAGARVRARLDDRTRVEARRAKRAEPYTFKGPARAQIARGGGWKGCRGSGGKSILHIRMHPENNRFRVFKIQGPPPTFGASDINAPLVVPRSVSRTAAFTSRFTSQKQTAAAACYLPSAFPFRVERVLLLFPVVLEAPAGADGRRATLGTQNEC